MFKKNKYSYSLDQQQLKCPSQPCSCPSNHVSPQSPVPSSASSSSLKLAKNNQAPNEDDIAGSPRTRKVGPPPLKEGVDYINPGEEDQMVSES